MVKQEQEIEFILFSLCAFEKSVDLVCNFIIIFIYVQKIYKSKESCKTSESGKDLVFFSKRKKQTIKSQAIVGRRSKNPVLSSVK